MGSVKNAAQEHTDKVNVALHEILIPAGVLAECDGMHSTYFEGEQDIDAVHQLGQANWGKLQTVFRSPDEMHGIIDEAYEFHLSESCQSCEKNSRD